MSGEDMNNEIEFSALEDVSDPLQRLKMLLDIRDILNDMVWFYNKFPELRNIERLDNADEISSGEMDGNKSAISEIEAMKNLLDAMTPSLGNILSSLSLSKRNIAVTGVSPILFFRSVEPIILMENTENPPLEIIQEINRRLSQVNEDLFSIEGYLNSPTDQETDGGNMIPNELEYLREAFVEDKPLWNIKETIQTENISFLLFDDEKVRMKAILDEGIDPRLHLGSIAVPLVYISDKEEEAAFHGIKTGDLLPIALKAINFYEKEDDSLFSWLCSLITGLIGEKNMDKLIAFSKLSEIVAFVVNVILDMKTGTEYIWHKHYIFGSLTIFCLLLPILSEMASKLIIIVIGWGKKFGGVRWQDIPPYEYFESFSRMMKKFTYTYRANAKYEELENIYSKLHYFRCIKGHQRFEKNALREDSTKIQHLCLALSHCNQILINQRLIAESLWENAPQFLIQMQALINHKWNMWTYLTICYSLERFSSAMNKAHDNTHKSSAATLWKHDFPAKVKIPEMLGYLLIYGTRFFSISVIFAIIPLWFSLSAVTYLVLLYALLTFIDKRPNHYRKLHAFKTTAFWPLARFYTIPPTIGVWRLDSWDHILFYLETVFMGTFIPYIFYIYKEKLTDFVNIYSPLFELIVLSCVIFSAIILFAFKKWFHETNQLCEKVNQIIPSSDRNRRYSHVQDLI